MRGDDFRLIRTEWRINTIVLICAAPAASIVPFRPV
jgi:hypothetical protein